MGFLPVEIDQFTKQIGKFSPVVLESANVILSMIDEPTYKNQDILHTINGFKFFDLLLVLIALLTSIAIFNIVQKTLKNNRNILISLFDIFTIIFQGQSNSENFSNFCFCIIICISFVKQLFNSHISTNLVIAKKHFVIDSIEDLLDERAKNFRPYVSSAGLLEQWILSSSDPKASALRAHFAKFDDVYVSQNMLSRKLYELNLMLSKYSYATIASQAVIRNALYRICDKKLYQMLLANALRKVYPHISRESYFPIGRSYLYNISDLKKEKRLHEL